MAETVLRTKLYIPPLRPNLVPRPHLIKRLNQGLQSGHKLTLISAPAGFGKTTLVSEWLAGRERPVAWLSLDEGDNDPTRFLIYLVAALQTLDPTMGEGLLAVLQSPQPTATESILTTLLNEIAALPEYFIFVLDDYHVIGDQPVEASTSVDVALTFLLDNLPPQMHVLIATREDPPIPLSRYRVRGQLTELRADDLRFTLSEAAGFLNQVMGLDLSEEDIESLEQRTEGWIAGLQLAALSMPGHQDATGFIQSFTGSHHFVLDYLVEEVLQQQSTGVQTFLLRTAILDRLCGSLCDAILKDTSAAGQETLEYLERANLFMVPLDNERRWYRYHHLFADLLRQRLEQQQPDMVGELHGRASAWYEANGLDIEAFHHAAAANDIERAERLIEGQGMPLHYRGALTPVLNWLASLPATILDARPSLWVTYASVLTMTGQPVNSIEEKLKAAEAALQEAVPNDKTNDLVGQIAAIRAMLAIPQNEPETMFYQSRRALEFLHPDNLPVRTTATWTLGFAYQLQGNRVAASQAYEEAIAISQASGNVMITMAAATTLGQIQVSENKLYLAAESFRRGMQSAGDPPQPGACEAILGLARISYQWNDLDGAQQHGQQSLQLARQLANVDTPAFCGIFLARLKLAQGDVAGAEALLVEAEQFIQRQNFAHRAADIAAAQVLTLLRQGNLAAAEQLAKKHDLPISQARVYLAQDDPSAALVVLGSYREQVEANDLEYERLKILVQQAVAYHADGEVETAVQTLGEALLLAEPGGFIRLFIDEGLPMAQLLIEANTQGIMPQYSAKLLTAFEDTTKGDQRAAEPTPSSVVRRPSSLIEPLSERELEVLQLIAQGLSNREISERLFISLSTVKGHNGRIYGKLQAQRRTEAVERARELGLL